MPTAGQPDTTRRIIIGIDTHKDVHGISITWVYDSLNFMYRPLFRVTRAWSDGRLDSGPSRSLGLKEQGPMERE
jgi:hypothetical protein